MTTTRASNLPTLSMVHAESASDAHFSNRKMIAGVSTPRSEHVALVAALELPPAERKPQDIELIQRATRHVKYRSGENWSSDPALHAALCRRLTYQRIHEVGENVFRQGSEGTTFYIVLSGACRVLKSFSKAQHQTSSEGLHVSEGDRDLQPGDSFGELALLGDGKRTATVEAVRPDTELLKLEKAAYDECLRGRQTAMLEERTHFLSTLYLFQDWSEEDRRSLARVLVRRVYRMNTTIIRQGATTDFVYLIYSGHCRVLKQVELSNGLEATLATSFPARRHDSGVRKLGVQSHARPPPSPPRGTGPSGAATERGPRRSAAAREPVLLELCELREGQHFGELALVAEAQKRAKKGKGTHTASVVAGEDCEVVLLEVNRHDLLRCPAALDGGLIEAMEAYASRYYQDYAGDDALETQIREQGRWDELKREAKVAAKSMTSKHGEVLRKLPAHISMAGREGVRKY